MTASITVCTSIDSFNSTFVFFNHTSVLASSFVCAEVEGSVVRTTSPPLRWDAKVMLLIDPQLSSIEQILAGKQQRSSGLLVVNGQVFGECKQIKVISIRATKLLSSLVRALTPLGLVP